MAQINYTDRFMRDPARAVSVVVVAARAAAVATPAATSISAFLRSYSALPLSLSLSLSILFRDERIARSIKTKVDHWSLLNVRETLRVIKKIISSMSRKTSFITFVTFSDQKILRFSTNFIESGKVKNK